MDILKQFLFRLMLFFSVIIIATALVLGIFKYDDSKPIDLNTYIVLDSMAKECPEVATELREDLKKGYIIKGEYKHLVDVWQECTKKQDEQKKKQIIRKYIVEN